jgi:hypothetical protein
MNVGEYGIQFNLNVNYNISAFTALSLVITRPDGTFVTRTSANVTVPGVPYVDPALGTFAANQYARYYFQAGDLNQAGTYTARLTYTNSGATPPLNLISDPATFDVNP